MMNLISQSRLLFWLVIFLAGFTSSVGQAIVLPPGFTQNQVASGLNEAVKMKHLEDGRLFVTERSGRIRLIKNGTLLSKPFLTLNVNTINERGLLGIEVDPYFGISPYIYVFYTTTTLKNRVSRFRAMSDSTTAEFEEVIFEFDDPAATVHNGGALRFGPDGFLYIAVGDNGVPQNAQSLSSLHGKILRIQKDGEIPSSNPFFDQTTGKFRAIWALGLRNPFTFDFRRSNGDMLINDVGENTWEEINRGQAGGNYGWPISEGPDSNPSLIDPIHSYNHASGGCAITGAAFYEPATQQFPISYRGRYFFGDFCAGKIWNLDPATGTASVFASEVTAPIEFAVLPDGSLYYIPHNTGQIMRIRYTGLPQPTLIQEPADQVVGLGQQATFVCDVKGSTPLSIQWKRNGTNISGATSRTLTVGPATLAQNGSRYRCEVTNANGSVLSRAALLTVLDNQPPQATIAQPLNSTRFQPGDTIVFSGSGFDSEDGNLSPSAMTWKVDSHHDDHVHAVMDPTSGIASGSFLIPLGAEPSRNVFYRVTLEVKDSTGLITRKFVDVRPAALLAGTPLQAIHADDKSTGRVVVNGDVVAWGLFSNGFIQDRWRLLRKDVYQISFRARGTRSAGVGPLILVKVDGRLVDQVGVDNTGYQMKYVLANLTAGIHTIRLEYVNDQNTSEGDRNVFIDWFSIAEAP